MMRTVQVVTSTAQPFRMHWKVRGQAQIASSENLPKFSPASRDKWLAGRQAAGGPR